MPDPEKITGYKELSPELIHAINTIKASEKNVAALWLAIMDDPEIAYDWRMMDLARVRFSEAYMYFVRAVAKPDDPFDAARVEDLLPEPPVE